MDDTQVSFAAQEFSFGEGGGMMSMSLAPPCDPCSTNGVTNLICSGPMSFVVSYQYSMNSLSLGIAQTTNTFIDLTIQTAMTNASYDVFGTTNLVALALPALSRTNWTWLVRSMGTTTSFSWGLTNWCERYFQLGTMLDTDTDGLTDAYESLATHTGTNAWDTDGDGVSDGEEVWQGRNPLGGVLADTGNLLGLRVFTPLR